MEVPEVFDCRLETNGKFFFKQCYEAFTTSIHWHALEVTKSQFIRVAGFDPKNIFSKNVERI